MTGLPRGVFYGVYALLALMLALAAAGGTLPVDYRTYQQAAGAIARGESPYGTPTDSRAVWRQMHRSGKRLDRGSARADDTNGNVEPTPGPYLYPPTLALILAETGVTSMESRAGNFPGFHPGEAGAIVVLCLLLIAVVGFGELWLRLARKAADRQNREPPSTWWLLLIAGSWDVIASFSGGNVELLVVGASLAAAWLLWRNHGFLAAPFIALVLVIKPFFVVLLGAFALLTMGTRKHEGWNAVQPFAAATVLVAALIGVEIVRWPPWLRADFLGYLQNAMAHQWLSLPVTMQTPMSNWNRSLLQVMITTGLAPAHAKWAVVILWGTLLGVTLWRMWGRRLSFPLVFGGAYVLFFVGRPVSWTLPYLGIVLLLAVRPYVRSHTEWTLLGGFIGVWLLSHWVALARTLSGAGADLLTLQTASFPWETLIVLPLAWFVVLEAAGRAGKEQEPLPGL